MDVIRLTFANLQRVNNAEYSFFSAQFVSRVEADSLEALKIPQTLFDPYKANATLLSDLVAKSRISHETAQIVEVRGNVKTILLDLLTSIRTAKKSTLAVRKEAGTFLYNVTKPYVGAYRLALRELIEKVKGLLTDLSKEDAATHVSTLGLNDILAELSSQNARLGILVNTRTANQLANATETSLQLRKEMNASLESMMFVVIGHNLVEPSDVRTDFITYVEKLITDILTEYKQRRAHSGVKTETSDTESDTTTDETPSNNTSEVE